MNDRLDRLETNIREDFKEVRNDITDIKISLQDLKAKQNFGMWLLKSIGTVTLGSIGALLGIHFHNFKIFK